MYQKVFEQLSTLIHFEDEISRSHLPHFFYRSMRECQGHEVSLPYLR